jgi:hypothetical protein
MRADYAKRPPTGLEDELQGQPSSGHYETVYAQDAVQFNEALICDCIKIIFIRSRKKRKVK